MSLCKNLPMGQAPKTNLRMAPLSHFGLSARKISSPHFSSNLGGGLANFGEFLCMLSPPKVLPKSTEEIKKIKK